MQKCVICHKLTDQCCSLCRSTFYCSPEHQEIDWHMKHKVSCPGKPHNIHHINVNSIPKVNTFSHQSNASHQHPPQIQAQFKIYTNHPQIQKQQLRKRQHQVKLFIELYQERLILRKKILSKYLLDRHLSRSNELTDKETMRQSMEEGEQLVDLSARLKALFSQSMETLLRDNYGVVANSFIMECELVLDRVLLARLYYKYTNHKQLRQLLIDLSNDVPQYNSNTKTASENNFIGYKNMLRAAIDISEMAGFDRSAEKMYACYVKAIEATEGVWEQIYAYFDFGVWYAGKTYYQKSIKCFTYALQLLTSHKHPKEPATATILKSELYFNLAQCTHPGSPPKSIPLMEQSYRLRVQGLGKNSLEASQCLLWLGRWTSEAGDLSKSIEWIEQCWRIRKERPGNQLGEVNAVIKSIYEKINKEKEQSEKQMNPKSAKYLQSLLDSDLLRENAVEYSSQKLITPTFKLPFTQRILQQNPSTVLFKLVISPELSDTLTSEQWSKIGELIDLVDKEMEKEEAIRLILESQFSMSLGQGQRQLFIRQNKIN